MKQIFKSILGILVISSSILFSSEFIEINYDGSADIYGFQFNYIGEGELIGASGGSAAAAGFTVSTGNNTVLGFSFSGSYIEGGDGILTIIEVDGEIGCIDNIILSGIGGSNLIANVDCNSFTYEEDIEIGGCNDIIACNYNPDATVNNGTCEYASDNFDCDGDCNTDIDCLGVCGGAAVNDECGVCNGDGSSCNGQESNTSIITYNTNVDIYGFQFRVDNVDLTGVYGGNAENAGFTVSYSAASGMVVGFSFSGLNGISVFYDYNLDNNRQFHFELDLTGPQVASVFKTLRLTNEGSDMESVGKSLSGNSLEINRTLFSTIYRWFIDDSLVWGISEGFFYGLGAGFGYSTLKYRGRDSNSIAIISGENETFNSTTTDYKHSTTGMGFFALLDAGWQGLQNYYFQVSIQPSLYLLYSDGFEEGSIPVNPGQRSIVKDRWNKSKNPSRIILGFGVFF